MPLYIRTETVDAHQWTPADPIAAGSTLGWLIAAGVELTHGPEATVTITVEDTRLVVRPGEWIVHHPERGYSVVDPDRFAAEYTNAETPPRSRRRTVINTVGNVSAGGSIIQTGGDIHGHVSL